jgi:hypothetical protein
MFVIKTLYNLSKCSFSDNLNQLKSIGDVITLLDAVVTFLIVKAIIHKSLHVWWFDFLLILAKIVAVIVVINFGRLKLGQVLLGDYSTTFNLGYIYRKFDVQIVSLINSQFISFRSLWYHRCNPVRLLPLTCRIRWLNLLHVRSIILRTHRALLLPRGCNSTCSLSRVF